MSLYANATDSKKIQTGIESILYASRGVNKSMCLVKTRTFYEKLGLSLPYSKFEAEVTDTVRQASIIKKYGNWVFSHYSESFCIFVCVNLSGGDLSIDNVYEHTFN